MASWFWLSGGLAVICFMFFLFSLLTSMSFIQHAKEPRSILKETLLSWLMLLLSGGWITIGLLLYFSLRINKQNEHSLLDNRECSFFLKISLATCQISLGNLTEIVKLFCRNEKSGKLNVYVSYLIKSNVSAYL